jgi:hypothetical protein
LTSLLASLVPRIGRSFGAPKSSAGGQDPCRCQVGLMVFRVRSSVSGIP